MHEMSIGFTSLALPTHLKDERGKKSVGFKSLALTFYKRYVHEMSVGFKSLALTFHLR